jgi:(1->4)-alpha-D-glucan 1-alpha-D-glucosylmutase
MSEGQSRFRRVPSATYRVQMTPDFGFVEAARIVPYLNQLGMSDLYCSPILKARPGSTHGYDVVDPLQLNPELGTQEQFDELIATLHQHGMGLLLDIVPNHMAASSENPWWLDVLENGPSSRYADFFDIEWHPPGPGELENRILLPILGSTYGETLENGEIQIEADDDGYLLRYYETVLPLSTVSYGPILRLRMREIERALGNASDERQAYAQILEQISHVPSRASSDADVIEKREQARSSLHMTLRRLRQIPAVRRELDRSIETINGTVGDPASFDTLDRIIAGQAYRLAYWQLAREQINYRRFFDINDLISMHVEDPNVFTSMHRRIIEMVERGDVDGLRIDHVDGLWNTEGYLDRLQQALSSGAAQSNLRHYVVVEKILSPGESLPDSWPVAGSTGYDFMNAVNGLLVDADGLGRLDTHYQQVSDLNASYSELVYRAKVRVLDESFGANIESLSVVLGRIADQDRHGRDLTFSSLRQTIIEVTAALPVYRTYIKSFDVGDEDRRWIETAVDAAVVRRSDLRHTMSFLRRVLTLQFPRYISPSDRPDWLHFVMRWQQLTGPAMAKGNEDTALYQYNRLLTLNEVGGHPDSAGLTVQEFHAFNRRNSERWAHTLNATSTHDTKRSEDVRARIAVLSEIPAEWRERFGRWQELNAGKRPVRNGVPIPDPNVEWLIYQTMVGAWPDDPSGVDHFRQRLKDYLTKASREAKTHTSWIEVDTVYESALHAFVDAIFDANESSEFLSDFVDFHRLVRPAGAINSLTQTLLKLTAPGLPDVYQGTELWDDSLVDPDNRRAVDYELRRRALDRTSLSSDDRGPLIKTLTNNWQDGQIKLWLMQEVLRFRREHGALFESGEYVECDVVGLFSDHVISFARQHGAEWAVVVAPRLVHRFVHDRDALSLAGHWDDTFVRLPRSVPESVINVLSQERVTTGRVDGERRIMIDDALTRFPVALLYGSV